MNQFYIVLFMLFSSTGAFAQWETVYFPFTDTLPAVLSISFSSPKKGIAACLTSKSFRYNRYKGSLITTQDSGITWITSLEVDSFSFEKVIHVDSTIAIAIGSHRNINWNIYNEGVIARTVDEGLTWDTTFFPYHIDYIEKANDSVIFAIGIEYFSSGSSNTKLLKSNDIGMTWNSIPFNDSSEIVYDIDFISDSIGFLVGQNGKIFKTINQGISWNMILVDPTRTISILNMDIPNSSSIYILSYGTLFSMLLYHSTDSGGTWNLISDSIVSFGASEVEFANDSVGYIPEKFNIKKTVDGGETWINQRSGPPSSGDFFDDMTDVFTFDEDRVYAAGFGQLYRTFNGGDTVIITSVTQENSLLKGLKVYPNPTFGRLLIENKSNQSLSFHLYTLLGREVPISAPLNVTERKFEFDISDLPQGIYLLQAIGEARESATIKIVKE
ncbi:MAG: T9SS type A sorting domain-containing protein [Flavobacteriales bacterium]|nr:T9SS type A sorting domain-containing protein [Flavobacteriales bacterium]